MADRIKHAPPFVPAPPLDVMNKELPFNQGISDAMWPLWERTWYLTEEGANCALSRLITFRLRGSGPFERRIILNLLARGEGGLYPPPLPSGKLKAALWRSARPLRMLEELLTRFERCPTRRYSLLYRPPPPPTPQRVPLLRQLQATRAKKRQDFADFIRMAQHRARHNLDG